MSHYSYTTFAVMAATSLMMAADCPPLKAGDSVQGFITADHSACFTVEIGRGDATLLAIDQSADIAAKVTDAKSSALIDGFESGVETVTLDRPGRYRIDLSPAGQANAARIDFKIRRGTLPLAAAGPRVQAEAESTAAKRSRKPEDYAAAFKLWQEVGDASAAGRIHLEQGDAAFGKGELPSAYSIYDEALTLCRSAGDLRCTSEAANNSGLAAQQLGDFEESQVRLTEAAADWKQLGMSDAERTTLSNLGLLFWQAGNYQEAIGYFDRTRSIPHSRGPVGDAAVLNNLGLCYSSLNEFDTAQDYFEKALRYFSQAHNGKGVVRARTNLGRNCYRQGKLAQARVMLRQALTEAIESQDSLARADVLNNLGQTLLAGHQPEEARQILLQALELHRKAGDRRPEAAALHYLGEAAMVLGETASARDYFIQALEMRSACQLRDAAIDSLYGLADLERNAGNIDAAREYAQRALALMESVRRHVPGPALRASYYARQRRFFDLLVDLAMSDPRPAAAEAGLLASEQGRGRALLDLLMEGSLLREIPEPLLLRRESIERRVDLLAIQLARARPEQAAALRHRAEMLMAAGEEIEARERQLLNTLNLSPSIGSVAELRQNLLPKGSSLLEYHLGERRSYLWLVRADSTRVFNLPARSVIEEQCAAVVKLFPDFLGRRRDPARQRAFERSLMLLSARLIPAEIGADVSARLIIAPDGILNRIPFAALVLPGNRRLGLTRDILQTPSAFYLAMGRAPRPAASFPKSILAIVDPVFSVGDPRVPAGPNQQLRGNSDRTWARLPFSQELETVSRLVPASRRRILRGFDATPEMIGKLPLGDYAVLHFSTHAVIDDRIPELSRIMLSLVDRSGRSVNGLLRPDELSQLHLNGSTVVLSACETALGKEVLGEGLVGFTTGLLHAGAAQLVVSLSPLDAEGASEFFRAAYGAVFGARAVNLEHSVTLARRALARSSRWSDPYYWASFVVYGRPAEPTVPRQIQ